MGQHIQVDKSKEQKELSLLKVLLMKHLFPMWF
jgi:hypothetical protein